MKNSCENCKHDGECRIPYSQTACIDCIPSADDETDPSMWELKVVIKTEAEIVHKIKKLKYEAQRQGCGFERNCESMSAVGNPLNMLTYSGQAATLQWVLGYEVEVKDINWYQKARKIYQRNLKKRIRANAKWVKETQ